MGERAKLARHSKLEVNAKIAIIQLVIVFCKHNNDELASSANYHSLVPSNVAITRSKSYDMTNSKSYELCSNK